MADVGEVSETQDSVGNHETHGIDRIVLDGEAGDRKMIDGEFLSGFEGDPIGLADIAFLDHVGGFGGGIERGGIFLDEIFQAAGVVAVFVGEEDGGDGCRIDLDGFEAAGELFGGEPGIDENAC